MPADHKGANDNTLFTASSESGLGQFEPELAKGAPGELSGGAVHEFDLFEPDDALSAAVLTQKSLIDTQDRLGVMLDIMPIGLLIHTGQGILFANQAACKLLKEERTRLIGQHLLDFVRPAESERVQGQFHSSFTGMGRVLQTEAVIGRAEGAQRLVRLITGKLPWEGNPVIQVLMEDITDQKRAEIHCGNRRSRTS